MTVMTWGNSEGTQGRCDAKCHNATEDTCTCMCGGAYHGAAHREGGLEQAMQDREEQIVEGIKKRAEGKGIALQVKSLRDLFEHHQVALF